MKTRKHICSECSKTFTRATILKDHLRAHEGTRPYNCGICGRAFTRRWDLKSHAQLHEQSAPHYDCDGCGARFHRKRDVLRHQERKKGSRCRTRQLASPRIDQDVQAAGALAGLKHGDLDHGWSRSTDWALCPLERPENIWILSNFAPIGHKPKPPRCQYRTGSGLASLRNHVRNHLRIVHDMYLLCADCKTYIQDPEGSSIAASRRSDRSLEARLKSARRASEIHKRRTGRSLRVTEQDIINEEMYEEEDDDLPLQYRRLTNHLQTGSSDFNRRLAVYLTNQVAMRHAMEHMSGNHYLQQYPGNPQYPPISSTMFQSSSPFAPECHDEACSSMDMPIESFLQGPYIFIAMELPSGEDEPRSKAWVALLPWHYTEPPKLSDRQKGTTTTPSIIDLDCDTVPTGQVTRQQTPAPPRAWPGLETGLEIDWDAWDSIIGDFAQPSSPNLEVVTPPAMPITGTVSETTAPPPSCAQEGTDQNQHIALQSPTLANIPAMSKEPVLSGHDDFSTPRLDLLKVVADVTKYLQEKVRGKVVLRLRYCQWKILQLLVARLDEISKTNPGVTSAHTDALWRAYSQHREAFCSDESEVFDKALDQVMRPLLHWSSWEPSGPLMSEWVADFELRAKHWFKSVTCPCEEYSEVLKPHGDCVTALYGDSVYGSLSYVAGDKIRLISKPAQAPMSITTWEGECIRTGKTGTFPVYSCA